MSLSKKPYILVYAGNHGFIVCRLFLLNKNMSFIFLIFKSIKVKLCHLFIVTYFEVFSIGKSMIVFICFFLCLYYLLCWGHLKSY